MTLLVITLLLVACFAQASASCQTWENVPGTVISHVPYDPANKQFVGSPSITIMPNGDYITAHDLFGSGTNEDQVMIFRSTDQGETWSNQSTVDGAFWETVFAHNGALYLMAIKEGGDDGDIVIRKSTDYGSTWTTPTNSTNGLLKDGNYGNTANVPVIHSDRIWIAQGRSVMSASVNSDLLKASSWKLSEPASFEGQPFGNEFQFFSEGQVVASPALGVHILPKLRDQAHTALIDVVETSGDISFDASAVNAFPFLPGGEKKFGAGYDAVSGKYYVLSNPVLKEHEGLFNDRPILIRNTAGILSSKDLINWDVEKLFLYASDPLQDAFQYLNFVIDDDDLAVVSRTAFDDGMGGPDNNHNSNFMTFHRVEDFRSAKPKHVLVADTGNDRVLRYEVTDGNEWAPLGTFTLGTTFDGQPLSNPVGVVQSANGDVFIADKSSTSGRLLRFDSSGNFLNTVATQGTDFTGDPEDLAFGPDGQVYMSVAFGDDSDKIYKIDPATGGVTTFVDTSFAPGQTLDNPRGLEFAPNGDLYVADRNSDAIRRFRGNDGAYLGDILAPRQPQALAWDEAGNQFVFSQRTTSSDTDIVTASVDGSITQVLYNDTDIGLALGAEVIDGDIFWTDYNNDHIYQSQPGQAKRIVVANGLNNPIYLEAVENVGLEAGESTWTGATSAEWDDPTNWYYWGRADTNEDLAIFGSAADAQATITSDSSFTLRGMRFRNSNSYILAGSGGLILESVTGNSTVDVQIGNHGISLSIQLDNHTNVTVAADASLQFDGILDLNGSKLLFSGDGSLILNGDLEMNGGTVAISGPSTLTFADGVNPLLDGDLHLVVEQPLLLGPGSSFDLLDGTEFLNDITFSSVILPELSSGLYWDTSDLYTDGEVIVATAVASDFDSDGDVDAMDLLIWQDHYGLSGNATRTEGDADGDGDVDGHDFLFWQKEFTGSLQMQSSNSVRLVPEPSVGSLLLVCTAVGSSYLSRMLGREITLEGYRRGRGVLAN